MYKDFIGKDVVVYVSTRADGGFLKYEGTLTSETSDGITLENASISQIITTFKVFPSNVDKIIINKKFVMSMYEE